MPKPKRKKPGTAVKRKVQPIAVDPKGYQFSSFLLVTERKRKGMWGGGDGEKTVGWLVSR